MQQGHAVLTRWYEGLGIAILFLSLFVYNGIRGLLTLRVSQLRDEEERSGFSPPFGGREVLRVHGWLDRSALQDFLTKEAWSGYWILHMSQRIARILFWSVVL